jgi:bacteriocin-like protein
MKEHQSGNKPVKTPLTHDKRVKTGKNDSVELTEDELKNVSGGAEPPDPCKV